MGSIGGYSTRGDIVRKAEAEHKAKLKAQGASKEKARKRAEANGAPGKRVR